MFTNILNIIRLLIIYVVYLYQAIRKRFLIQTSKIMKIKEFILKFGIAKLQGQKVLVGNSIMTIELSNDDLYDFEKDNFDSKYSSFDSFIMNCKYRFMVTFISNNKQCATFAYSDAEVIEEIKELKKSTKNEKSISLTERKQPLLLWKSKSTIQRQQRFGSFNSYIVPIQFSKSVCQ